MKDENIKEYIETLKEIVGNGGSKGTYGISYNHWKQLLDYITNLQEENKHIFANVNDDQLLRSNAMNYAELQDYKTRNKKAIEYIEEHIKYEQYEYIDFNNNRGVSRKCYISDKDNLVCKTNSGLVEVKQFGKR